MRFDSSCSFTGLDFLARSVAKIQQNGTFLDPKCVAGNMHEEQKEIFMCRLAFHQERINHTK
ncbi:hypothetical protein [Trabulsiella odontotermitis]|uniref:hypothetical protein n=1 Tax=Trabulsiella odontotermitis TaxID=379893 RepID=UPI0038B3079F